MTRRVGTSGIGARSYRKLFVALLAVVALIAALAIYLVVTTPKTAEPVRFPLRGAQRELLAHVPATAEAFALIPSAAMLHAKLLANPVTRDAASQWTEEH